MRKTNELRNLDVLKLPKRGLAADKYLERILDLETDATIWDRGNGRISWIQGKLLNLARESCKKRNEWSQFLQTIRTRANRMSVSTVKHLRKIADVITEDQSFVLGYSEMLAIAYPSYKKELAKDEKQALKEDGATKVKTKGSKGTSDPAFSCIVGKMVTDLTAGKETLQQIRESLPDKIPHTATLQNVGHVITALKEISNDAAHILQVVESWKTKLTGKIAA